MRTRKDKCRARNNRDGNRWLSLISRSWRRLCLWLAWLSAKLCGLCASALEMSHSLTQSRTSPTLTSVMCSATESRPTESGRNRWL